VLGKIVEDVEEVEKRGTFSALPAEQNIVGGLALNPDRG
jgi:hypothetical protein